MPHVPHLSPDEPPHWAVWMVLAALVLGVVVLSLIGCNVPQFGTGRSP